MRNARLDEAQAGIKITGRNISNLRYADDTTLMAESEEEPKTFWWEWKRRVKKLAENSTFKKLRSCIWSHHFMASSWETVETVSDFNFGASKSLQMWLQPWNKKTLAPWKKSYDQPRQHIKKQRHYFANKGPSSPSYGFSSVSPSICHEVMRDWMPWSSFFECWALSQLFTLLFHLHQEAL